MYREEFLKVSMQTCTVQSYVSHQSHLAIQQFKYVLCLHLKKKERKIINKSASVKKKPQIIVIFSLQAVPLKNRRKI